MQFLASRFQDAMYTIRMCAGNLLFPPICPVCEAATEVSSTLCTACFNAMRMISAPYCERCGQPFEYAMDWADLPCPACVSYQPNYDAARAVWQYDAYSAKLVQKLKYADHTHLSPYLATIMRGQGAALLEMADIITPVPLHYRRLIHRRYNQSLLLARQLHRQLRPSIILIPHLLKRQRNTPPQASLSQKERMKNVKNAFCVHPSYKGALKNASVLLIDDVITTGATLNACAIALKESGAKWVGVLTLAKTIEPANADFSMSKF